MKQTRILKLIFLGIGIFLSGFILFFVLCPHIYNSGNDRLHHLGREIKNISRQVKWRCLYGQPYRRSTSAFNICCENQTKIDHAAQEWALENKKPQTAIPTIDDLEPYFRKGWPSCPYGGDYVIKSVGENPVCSLCGAYPTGDGPRPPILIGRLVLLGIGGLLTVFLICLVFTRSRRQRRERLAIRVSS